MNVLTGTHVARAGLQHPEPGQHQADRVQPDCPIFTRQRCHRERGDKGNRVLVEEDGVLTDIREGDVGAILGLSRATYRKMVQNLIWATGYNTIAVPMAAGITFGTGFLMTPAIAAVFMSASTVIVAINAQLLRFYRRQT